MLQQTQVNTVVPYFLNFVKHYPSLKHLSKAKEDKVLKLWEGLGYYRRARNLLSTAKLLSGLNSRLPTTIIELKKFPGVGDYTANALMALVYNKPTLAIDGNVKRVFSRILNKEHSLIDFEELKKANKNNLSYKNRNSDFVEALMEFGAIICKPKNPLCISCNLKKNCKFIKAKKKYKIQNLKKPIFKKINIFCYLNYKKQIGLTKKNQTGFLGNFILPEIKDRKKVKKTKWHLLSNFNHSISNKKLNINLYYKFAKKIPYKFEWYSINSKKDFIPVFTKKILTKLENLYL